ncbi:MAG: GspE/PulE family protein [Synergistales bacterium]|nr:GspE/PulE family protein [Synergistales bacterium]
MLPDSVSLDYLRQHSICPVEDDGEMLTVAVASMDQFALAQLLGAASGKAVDVATFSREEIDTLVRSLYDLKSGLEEENYREIEEVDDLNSLVREDVLSDSVDAPVIKLVNGLIREALKERATDIHFEPYENEVIVRYRIDGVLHEKMRLPKGHQAPLSSRVKVMARMDIADRFVPQDGRIGITIGDRAVDIRVGSIPTQHGERLALRLLDKSQGLLTLEDLGMSGEESAKMSEIIKHPYGMILLTGPTGSGKSTTLYAILQELASPDVNIITVEDPVEYDVPGISQIQVNEKAGVTFASSLRAILRQDPDIVMVGEMRDYDTAHIGVQASLTGHLVLSTLHTNDSCSAVVRLTDMGLEPYLVAGSLLGVVAQRLARRICPYCREAVTPPPILRDSVERAYRGRGCEHCHGTGYRGRVGLYEELMITPELQDAVAHGTNAVELKRIAARGGFKTLWEIGLQRLSEGITSPEELLRVVGEA